MTATLEAALQVAVEQSLFVPVADRVVFIAQHMLAQADGSKLPKPPPAASDKDRKGSLDKKAVAGELAALATALTSAINGARGQPGWPVRAVATALLDLPSTATVAAKPAIDDHCRLGLTVAGLQQLIKELPAKGLQIVKKRGKYPISLVDEQVNGYVLHHFLARKSEADGLSACERLQQSATSAQHVGPATMYVSWPVSMALDALYGSLTGFLQQHGLDTSTTFFWVHDCSIRHAEEQGANGGSAISALERVPSLIRAIGHTVFTATPWMAPDGLSRSWVLWELYHTHAASARFHLALDAAQAAAFKRALGDNYGAVVAAPGGVNVSDSTACAEEDAQAVLAHVKVGIGCDAFNERVRSLMWTEYAQRAVRVIEKLPAGQRGASSHMDNVGRLMYERGDCEQAVTVLRRVLEARRQLYGPTNSSTLISMVNLSSLLQARGDLEEAQMLVTEALVSRNRGTLLDTISAVRSLEALLRNDGHLDQAVELARLTLTCSLETLAMGQPEPPAAQVAEEHPVGRARAADADHQGIFGVLGMCHNLGIVLMADGKGSAAATLLEELVHACTETLGNEHPNTLVAMSNHGALLKDQGEYEKAVSLLRHALGVSRVTLGDRNPLTLTLLCNLGQTVLEAGVHGAVDGDVAHARRQEADRLQANDSATADAAEGGMARGDAGGEAEGGAKELPEATLTLTAEEHATLPPACASEAAARQGGAGEMDAPTAGRSTDEAAALPRVPANDDLRTAYLEEAAALLRESLTACRETLGDEHVDTASAAELLRQVLRRSEHKLGRTHPEMVLSSKALEGLPDASSMEQEDNTPLAVVPLMMAMRMPSARRTGHTERCASDG